MGASYDGRAAVPSISREGVTQKSCRVTATRSIIKVTEQSACFGHGGVTAFTERRVTGVLVAYCVRNRRYATRHTAFTWCSMLSVESYTILRFFVVANGYIKQPSTVTWMFVATVNRCFVPKVIIFVLLPFSSSRFSRNQEWTSFRQCWSSWSAFFWSHGRNKTHSGSGTR